MASWSRSVARVIGRAPSLLVGRGLAGPAIVVAARLSSVHALRAATRATPPSGPTDAPRAPAPGRCRPSRRTGAVRRARRPDARRRPGPGASARVRDGRARPGDTRPGRVGRQRRPAGSAVSGRGTSLIAAVGRDAAGRALVEAIRSDGVTPRVVARRRRADRPDRRPRRPRRRAQLRGRSRRRRPARARRPARDVVRRRRRAPPAGLLAARRAARAGRPAGDRAGPRRRERIGQRRPRLDRAAARRRAPRGPRAHRGRSRRTCCSRPRPRPRRSSADAPSRGCSTSPRPPSSSAAPKGATVLARLGGERVALRGRDRAPDRHRHDRRRRRVRCRVPRRLVRGSARRADPCRPRSSARRSPATGRRPVSCRRRRTGAARSADGGAALPVRGAATDRGTDRCCDVSPIAPEVAAALAAGRPVVALESTLISHGLPYPQNLEVATASEAAVRASGAVPATVAIRGGPAARRARRGRARGARDGAGRIGPQGRPAESRGGARRRRLGRHDGLGDDDRGARGRDPRSSRPAGSAASTAGRSAAGRRAPRPRRRSTSRPTSRSWAARRWPSSAPARRPSSTSRPRSSTSRRAASRSSRSARPTLPGFFARSAGIAAPSRCADIAAAAAVVATQLGLGLGGGILVCVPGAGRRGTARTIVAREAVEQAIAEPRPAGIGGPALTPMAARADRRPDRRRLDPCQHRADRQRRARGRASSRAPGLRVVRGRARGRAVAPHRTRWAALPLARALATLGPSPTAGS